MPKKPCAVPGCRRLVPVGQARCLAHERSWLLQQEAKRRRYDARRGTAAERGYDQEWRKVRAEFLKLHPWCEAAGCDSAAEEVHHIRALRHGGTHDPANLLALCKKHHAVVTARGLR